MNTNITRRHFGLLAASTLLGLLVPVTVTGSEKKPTVQTYKDEFKRYYRTWSAHVRRALPTEQFPPPEYLVFLVSIESPELGNFLKKAHLRFKEINDLGNRLGLDSDTKLAIMRGIKAECDESFKSAYDRHDPYSKAEFAMLYYGDFDMKQPENDEEKLKIVLDACRGSQHTEVKIGLSLAEEIYIVTLINKRLAMIS